MHDRANWIAFVIALRLIIILHKYIEFDDVAKKRMLFQYILITRTEMIHFQRDLFFRILTNAYVYGWS